ncbi:MAG: putative 4-hydroxybenzoate polyprenyltransferase [Thermoplasmata archaeon]|nr:putative 4-hydroxybenzoate polyprenyltransferase [Thermoplasmata archaeon]
MTADLTPRGRLYELGRFLEIQNVGLNLPFALAFLLLAAGGIPSLWVVFLVVVAFVSARNAGHSFNRWADRDLDAANPRTRNRAIPSGRRSPASALAITAFSGAVLLVAAYLLNPLAFLLAPVALATVLGYSYTKRYTALTTPFLGLVEAVVPAAVFIAVQGRLDAYVLFAVFGLLAWGTAFETIHSLGDLESDRALRLHSLPDRIGVRASVRLVPVLHAVALLLLGALGFALELRLWYFLALAAMAALAAVTDLRLARSPASSRIPFQRHFQMAGLYCVGVVLALFLPFGPHVPGL